MKRITGILICIVWALGIHATISQNQAFLIAEKFARDTTDEIMVSNLLYNKGDSVKIEGDYAICPIDSAWCVFIDFFPLHDWRHECAYVFVGATNGDTACMIKNTPPASILTLWTRYRIYSLPLEKQTQHKSLFLERLRNPQGTSKNQAVTNTNVREGDNSGIDNYPSVYAVILNCSYSAYYNLERHWNDCAGMYNAFRSYGIPKENIFTAFGLNDSTKVDMRSNSGADMISPKDFDGDGLSDIRYPAISDSVFQLFNDLRNRVDENDIVIVYIEGQGNLLTNNINKSSCGPFVSNFYDYHIADSDMGRIIANLGSNVVNVFIQRTDAKSFSGCLTSQLGELRNYVVTWDKNDQPDSVTNYQYNPFTFDLISALTGMTPDSVTVSADFNNDGKVSMKEVYDYLANHATPTSSYSTKSNPICLSSILALDELLNEIDCDDYDLFIRDNIDDNGATPNLTTDQSYISPDIWAEDLLGNPVDVLESGETYNICVRISNRGNISSPGNEILHLHWTKGVIGGRWPDNWIEGATYDCGGTSISVGGEITAPYGEVLPSIDSQDEYVARVQWTTPDNSTYSSCSEFVTNNDGLWHYCLLARIYDEQEEPGEDMTYISMKDFVLQSNNVASKNITIMSQSVGCLQTAVVGLTAPYTGTFSLKGYSLTPDVPIGLGGLLMYYTLSENLTDSWPSPSGTGFTEISTGYLQISSDTAIIDDLFLYEGEMYSLKLDMYCAPDNYRYCIALIDEDGFSLGGNVFRVINNTRQNAQQRRTSRTNIQFEGNQSSIDCVVDDEANCLRIKTQEKVLRVSLLGCTGNILLREENITALDLSSLPVGMYIVVVETEHITEQFKILKNK